MSWMSKKAFTLIELLIVVAIIAILSAIAVPNFLEAQTRAKVSRVKSDFRTLSLAFHAFFLDHNDFPPDIAPTWDTDFFSFIPLTTPRAYIFGVRLTHVYHENCNFFPISSTSMNSDKMVYEVLIGRRKLKVEPSPSLL